MKHDLTDIMATLEVSHATLNMIADRIDNYTRTLGSLGDTDEGSRQELLHLRTLQS